MSTPTKEWYCPLPFISISSDSGGHYALCCESQPAPQHCTDTTLSEFKNSDYMNNVRAGFESDDPKSVPEIKSACNQCISKELDGATSKRMREIKNTEQSNYLELKLIGNICNYACVMCNPLSSSKIAEAQGLDIPKWFKLSDEWWDDFDEISKDYTHYKFSGGEPFMSPTTTKILKRLVASGKSKDMVLQFNTNGAGSTRVVQKLLDNFKSISLGFSIDAWGGRNELIRKHSKWTFTEDMLWGYANLARLNKNLNLTVHPCVSALNVGYLYEFDEFVREASTLNRFSFSVTNTLAYPGRINISRLPSSVKKEYLKNNYDFLSSGNVKGGKDLVELLTKPSRLVETWSPTWLEENLEGWEEWYPEFLPYV